MSEINIVSIDELLKMPLFIPDYQRPYKWTIQNIEDLLSDITNSITDAEMYRTFKYRIGTIILHKNDDGKYDVVDGQQRIISLTLLKHCIEPDYTCSILEKSFTNKTTQSNIHRHYYFIREWFSLNSGDKKNDKKNDFIHALDKILEVVVICVDKVSEAFQLFDSQNTRGKALDPHDLLKAYHLREMKKYPYEMEHAVKKWEAKDTKQIRELFDLYLFPIWNWSRGIKSKSFTASEIDTYKGISETSMYTYARRASKAMPYFQITEPFIAGNDFFEIEIALSNFLKGKIDIGLFAQAYHQIITAGYAEESMPCGYFKSGMILSGLSKPDHIKIWLDDVRKAPDGYCHCHSVNETIKKIIECEEELTVIDEINCDHDLGDYSSDGGDGIKLIDWIAERKTYYPIKLHTMNPVGRENMQREIDRYWNKTK